LTMKMKPMTTAAITVPTTSDLRTALPIMVSSAWTNSSCSSGGGDGLVIKFRAVARRSLNGFAGREQPSLRVMRETNVRVIILSGRRGEQQQCRLGSPGGLGASNQFLPDACALV